VETHFLLLITPEHVKEARALLGWSTKLLADEAALGVKILEAFEQGLSACYA
jgi:ribosome-binding protein aMBF1 (putative translation factor)